VPVYAGNKVKKIYLYPEAYDNYYSDQLTVSGTKRNTRVVNAQKTINIDNYASISVYDQLKKNLSSDIRLSNYSGTPAAGSAMLVRGINSLNANVQPLIVVDGVILDNQEDKISIHEGNIVNTLSSIDVNDIQSVSVLKDGTSLYGSKGGNGVILVTTNRGRSMATKITATTMIGYNTKPNITPMMNSSQYRVYLTDLLKDEEARKKIANQFFLTEDEKFIYYKKHHNNTNWSDGIYDLSLIHISEPTRPY
jgi:TonB-dependent SusC/RagA subfamily outer membrane receptor